jgi:hypothetical protein
MVMPSKEDGVAGIWSDSWRRASAANRSLSTAPAFRPARWRSVTCRTGRFAPRRRPYSVFTPHGGGARTAAESPAHSSPNSCTRFIPPTCASGSPATAACPGGLSFSRAASLPPWCQPATRDPSSAPTPRRARSGRDYFPAAQQPVAADYPIVGLRAQCAVEHATRMVTRSVTEPPRLCFFVFQPLFRIVRNPVFELLVAYRTRKSLLRCP